MAVSDLAIYSRAQAAGVLASSLFVGGNTVVLFMYMPSLKPITQPMDRIRCFSRAFDLASKMMIGYAGTATVAFGTAAYYAPTAYLRNSMIASAALAFSIFPYTAGAVIPTVEKIKKIEGSGDEVKATSEGDALLDKWTKLAVVRFVVMGVALLNGLKELSEWYEL